VSLFFGFTPEQLEIREAVRSALAGAVPPSRVRSAWSAPDLEMGPLLASIGALGIEVPEAAGGMALGPTWWVTAAEEAGHVALPFPLAEVIALQTTLTQTGHGDLLARLAAGEALVTVGRADGYTVDADRADAVFVVDGDRLGQVVQPTLTAVQSVDGARRLFRVDGDVTWLDADGAAVFDRAALATAAELIGVSRRMIAMSVEYAKARQQFGKAIGSFQAVQHHLVDATLAVAFAAPLVYRAAASLETGDPLSSVHVSMAKHHASEAATLAARKALQVHGAIGYTFECDLHLWMKRAWSQASAWGDARFHADRVANHLLEHAHG